MPPTNSRDLLRTADYEPGPAPASPDVTAAHTPGSSTATGDTGAYVPGEAVERECAAAAVSVPGYEIEGVLGHGGMGVVYKARHLALKRTVALKMILASGHAGPQALARFRIEAEAVARLQHPNNVQLFEVGAAGGHPFCALEFVEGGTLAGKLNGQPLPVREAARLVEALARAMHLAHSRNVVHRDLKPANILLARDGTPKITDFGLARQMDSDSGETQAGAVIGTPSYMAPEQASGRAHEAGPAADVYALGAILYVCLAGRPPFQGNTVVETLDQVRMQDPVLPSRWQPGLPLDLETICLKCLRKEPEKRYASAAELADELVRYQHGEPIQARPVGRAERVWRWCQRNPWVASLVGAVAASLLLAMAGTSYYAIQSGNRELEALANARKAREEKALSDPRWYAAECTLAQKDWEEGELISLQRRLDVLEPHELDAPDLRGFEWYHLQRLCRLDLGTLPGHAAPVRCVAFSPDGKLLASASGDYGQPGEVKVWDVATGRELFRLSGHKDLVSCVAFSPDGHRLAAANGGVRTQGEIIIWDAADGRERRRIRAHATPVRGLAFSPDGRQLASVGGGFDSTGSPLPGEVKVWDAADGKHLLGIPGNQAANWLTAATAVAFNPAAAESQRRFAFADGHTIRVCDAATGKEHFRLGEHPSSVNSVAYSPDGRRLASGSIDGVVKVWDANTGKETLAFHDAGGIAGLVFSPDGRRLAAAVGSNIVKVWDVTTRKEALVLRGHKDAVASVAFSPDGWRLASGGGDGTVKLWDATAAVEAVTLSGLPGVEDMAFDPDGRQLAVAGADRFRWIKTSINTKSFGGEAKWWAPNHNSTFVTVPEDELGLFEAAILKPYFGMALADFHL